ncbi:MAG: uL15 family ribosomal protein [bacterium]
MQIHQVIRKHPNKGKKIVGRGGKRGTTSGKGTKGQLARSGRKLRPEMRDTIKKIPKLRGYRFSSIQNKPVVVKLSTIDKSFKDGDTVSIATLFAAGVIQTMKGKIPSIKILGNEAISKKLNIVGCVVSAGTKATVEKAGGTVKSK